MAPFLSSLQLLLFLFFFPLSFSSKQNHKVYMVYLGEHSGSYAAEEIQENHHALLFSVKNSEEEARKSMLYSYKNSINGFAALLSDKEAEILSDREEVISAYPSESRWAPHTTRSWEFMTGYEEGKEERGSGFGFGFGKSDWAHSKANHGQDVIVGMLDSGIWPESKSFSDEGLGPVPARWRGICEEGQSFKSSSCNRKIIGARYYLKSYEAYYGSLNTSYAYRSPRDGDGHGTHTSSTVAGRLVSSVSALGGFANGTASGGAPLARLAVYKVCWPIPGPNPNIENTCFEADILAAIDDAIGDGVDVMSISIGSVGDQLTFARDGIAVGALHAAKRDIVVVCSAGNSGPKPATVSNLAPWMITVGASSIDRAFTAKIRLGNSMIIMGQTVTPYQLKGKAYPLIYAGDAAIAGTPANLTGQCLPNSLSPEKVKGKMVVCLRGSGLRVAKGHEVKRAGGAGMILGNAAANGNEVPVDAHVLPGAGVSASDATRILTYINSSGNPTASLGRARTLVDVKPSPSMAQFSSRGPSVLEPNILKPDITAPGLNILAAWSESSSPTKLDGDKRRVKYNIISGTSMSCPHVSAAAALLKSMYPHWSSSAIRSAMMTTATVVNAQGRPLMNGDGTVGGPFDYGSGHVRPIHAADPGLVYDASYEDYLMFMCAIADIQMDFYFPCPKDPPLPYALNHPSLAISRLNGTVSVVRTVTNVAQGEARYQVTIVEPDGVSVKISPKVLKFKDVGEKKSFSIVIKVRGSSVLQGNGTYVSGSYTWCDNVHSVRSPIVVSFG